MIQSHYNPNNRREDEQPTPSNVLPLSTPGPDITDVIRAIELTRQKEETRTKTSQQALASNNATQREELREIVMRAYSGMGVPEASIDAALDDLEREKKIAEYNKPAPYSSSKALASMGKKIATAAYHVGMFLVAAPTLARQISPQKDQKDIFQNDCPGYTAGSIVITSFGSCMITLGLYGNLSNDSVIPLIGLTASLTCNSLSGLYEWFRYERMQANKETK